MSNDNYPINIFSGVEQASNLEQKCLCVLVVDVSSSMGGEPIKQLNRGLQDFQRDVADDFVTSQRLEVSLVTFGSLVNCLQKPALIDSFQMPTLGVNGSTKLVDGVRMGLDIVETRKRWYKETGQTYYRPMLILITDGEPDGDQDLNGLSAQIAGSVANKGVTFLTLGVDGYNNQKLSTLCPPPTKPMPLKGHEFSKFFKWLSNSIGTGIIKSSDAGQTPKFLPPGEFDFLGQIEM
jgi:uncharacterized protein YegL